jgi:hypothetical protein
MSRGPGDGAWMDRVFRFEGRLSGRAGNRVSRDRTGGIAGYLCGESKG